MGVGARGRRPTPTADLVRKEREALEYRRAGMTYDMIAEKVGYANKGGAYKAVQSALKRTLQEPADELRNLEVDRLDRLLFAVWPSALKGDVKAVDRVLRIAERRSKLLGLDVTPSPDAKALDTANNLLAGLATALGLSEGGDA